jgi:hypothetical protein
MHRCGAEKAQIEDIVGGQVAIDATQAFLQPDDGLDPGPAHVVLEMEMGELAVRRPGRAFTPALTRITEQVEIDMPQPRNVDIRSSPRFQGYALHLRHGLGVASGRNVSPERPE